MAMTQAICNSYKLEILQGIHSTAHTYKFALYNSSATWSKDATAYAADHEATGGGYVAGGIALTGCTAALSGDIAYLDFDNAVWSTGSFYACGGMIYNSNAANKAVAIIDFSGTYTCANGEFKVTFPAPGAAAIVRIT